MERLRVPARADVSETDSESTDSHNSFSPELEKRVRFFGDSDDNDYKSKPKAPVELGNDEIFVANPTRHLPSPPPPPHHPRHQKNGPLGTSVDSSSSSSEADSETESEVESESEGGENAPLNKNNRNVESGPQQQQKQKVKGQPGDILINLEPSSESERDSLSNLNSDSSKDKMNKPFNFLSLVPRKLRPIPEKENSEGENESDRLMKVQGRSKIKIKVKELPVDVGNLETDRVEMERFSDPSFSSKKRKKSYEAAIDNPQEEEINGGSNGKFSRSVNGFDRNVINVNRNERWRNLLISVGIGVGKTIILLFLLYMFVCSLDLLSLGFRLIGGKTAGEMFRKSDILQNPVVGLMIGILTTVLVQSSSTATSIIVGMVAANFLQVQVAIPIIMGSNIGTSITNTLVAVGQAGDREQFRLAFAGATLLDMFNWLTVIILLPLEVITGYLYYTTNALMRAIMPDQQSGGNFQLLSVLTRPFVNLIVQLDRNVLECWSSPNCTHLENASLIREYCGVRTISGELVQNTYDSQGNRLVDESKSLSVSDNQVKCDFIFAGTPLNDAGAGAIILVVSLIVLCTCLILIVKVLSSVLKGHVATMIQKTLNSDIPYVPWLTGYIAIMIGAILTFLVQSSSVFTSSILNFIVGTTTTALLASMAVEGKALFPSMQIALCHALFNISGIILFYPVPFLRFPIDMAKFLGKTTAKYRWFALVYIVGMFALFPALTISLSFGGPIPVIIFCSIITILLLFVTILTIIQRKKPSVLPPVLRSWKFLPLPLRSLQPYDDLFTRFNYCQKLGKEKTSGDKNSGKIPEAESSSKNSNNNENGNRESKNESSATKDEGVIIHNNHNNTTRHYTEHEV